MVVRPTQSGPSKNNVWTLSQSDGSNLGILTSILYYPSCINGRRDTICLNPTRLIQALLHVK